MATISKSAAIAHAIENVRMVQVSAGSYEIQRYDEARNAWIASNTMDYHRARPALTEARHESALMALGWDNWDAGYESAGATGSLRERIARSVND